MAIRKFNFTKREIESLPIPAGKTDRIRYYDTRTRGLCLRVTGGGQKSFTYYRKVDGRPWSFKLGDFPDMSVEQARDLVDELNAKRAKKEKISDAAQRNRSALTLEELFDVYIEKHAKKRKTWEVMKKDFDRCVKPLRRKIASEISHDVANDLHASLGKSRGQYTANRVVQLLRAVYNKGKQWKHIDCDNPFAGITLFKERARERFLSRDEAKKLLKALDKADEDLADFVKLSLFTGVRKSNVLSMRWEDIDLRSRTPTWKIPDTKNDTSQTIALGPNELDVLKKRQQSARSIRPKSPFVFPGTGKSGHLMDLKRSWASIRESVGLEDCTIHDLRRSLGAAMASNNVNLSIIKSALNHKDMKTTVKVYDLTNKEAERDARQNVQAQWLDDE